jgi:hypothetical protein
MNTKKIRAWDAIAIRHEDVFMLGLLQRDIENGLAAVAFIRMPDVLDGEKSSLPKILDDFDSPFIRPVVGDQDLEVLETLVQIAAKRFGQPLSLVVGAHHD